MEVDTFHLVVVVLETSGDFIVQVHIFTVCFEYLLTLTVPCCLMYIQLMHVVLSYEIVQHTKISSNICCVIC